MSTPEVCARPPAGVGGNDEAWQQAPHLSLGTTREGVLDGLFAQLAVLVLRHPVAAQAAFAALVAEGRRFAQTDEGRRWRDALADSELVRRGRALWEGSVLNLLEDDREAMLPSALVDAIARAASRGELGSFVGELLGPGALRGARS